MARPREFDQATALDAMIVCFWRRGYQSTSVRDLIDCTGMNAASLYNAFGDKRALYHQALSQYVLTRIVARISRCEVLKPRDAIEAFFVEALRRSAGDETPRGCMLVNAALEDTPNDTDFRDFVNDSLRLVEAFFLRQLEAGQKDGTITDDQSPTRLARHLLAVHSGIRILARTRPSRELVEDAVASALAILHPERQKASRAH